MQPNTAMIFAAGFGTRMGHLTKNRPKPLVHVLGRPMIDHTLDILADANIRSIFVNTHYFADQLEAYLSSYSSVTCIREEPKVLETGGGLKNALPYIESNPVFTLNCDVLWRGNNPAKQLLKRWKPDEMDGLLLLVKYTSAYGYKGQGDFFLKNGNSPRRKGTAPNAPYVYSGIQIIKTDLLRTIKENHFSISLLWEDMIASDRLRGTVYDGEWIDVGHAEGIGVAEQKCANV
jgi:MurNAc alpha-1-phosphate uridylyltransferase